MGYAGRGTTNGADAADVVIVVNVVTDVVDVDRAVEAERQNLEKN